MATIDNDIMTIFILWSPVEYSSQVVHLIMQEVTEDATNETMQQRMMSLTDLMSEKLRLSLRLHCY